MSQSLLDQIAVGLDDEALDEFLASADEALLEAIADEDWSVAARPEQLPPEGDWYIWLLRAGRGYGKTRAGAEWALDHVRRVAGAGVPVVRLALVSQKFGKVRDEMVEGETGLLRYLPPSELVGGSVEQSWNRSLGQLRLADGHLLQGYSSEKPGQLRGPQQHGAWGDEAAIWNDAALGLTKDIRRDTTIGNLILGTRLPPDPRIVLTTTPKDVELIHDLHDDPRVEITTGSTYENVHNLGPIYVEEIVSRYEGSMLGAQELHGQVVRIEGALIPTHKLTAVPDRAPEQWRRVRTWDFAATEASEASPDPDWTVGTLVARSDDHRSRIEDVVRVREGGGTVEAIVQATASRDGRGVPVVIEQEGGAFAKAGVERYASLLRGYRVVPFRPTGPKAVRAELMALDVDAGRVEIVAADWNIDLIDEMRTFPDGGHDDQVDTLSMAWTYLEGRRRAGVRGPSTAPADRRIDIGSPLASRQARVGV